MGPAETSGRGAAARLPSKALRAVHELFVAGEVDASFLDTTPLRRVVAESWRRSLAKGVDPDRGGAQASAIADSVARMRTTHPLAATLPVIRRLLVQDATDSGVVVAVTAADGTLLWVEGDPKACRKAEAMNFVPGADWSESGAGTNAPGTALACGSRTADPRVGALFPDRPAVELHRGPRTRPRHRRAARRHRPHRRIRGRLAADAGPDPRHRRRGREPAGAACV